MGIKDKFIESKPAEIAKEAVGNALGSAKDAVGKGLGSAISGVGDSLGGAKGVIDAVKGAYSDAKESLPDELKGAANELEKYAEQKAKEEADKKTDELQTLIEEKVVEIIQETGASPDDAEKVVALTKEHFPTDEADAAISDTTKKLLS